MKFMMKFIKEIIHKLRSTLNYSVEPDIYVISFPKSGRTWLRVLIGKYLSLKYNLPENKILSTMFMSSSSGLPTVRFSHGEYGMKKLRKNHRLSDNKQKYADKKVILLGREIKDTLISGYFHATKRARIFEGSISEYIASETFGASKIIEFYVNWTRSRHIPDSFLFIRYEDLQQDTENTLRKTLSFIGEISIEENLLRDAIEYCSFPNLKKLEAENKFQSDKLKPADMTDPESFKVRKGKIGGYKEYLSDEDIVFIDQTIMAQGHNFSKFE